MLHRILSVSLWCICLWRFSCKSLHTLEVTLNKCPRKIWKLPFNTHTHTHTYTHTHTVQWRFKCFLDHSFSSSYRLVSVIFREAGHLCYTFTGFSIMYGNTFRKQYSDQDYILCADVIRHFRYRPHSVQLFKSEQLQTSEILHVYNYYFLMFLCYLCYSFVVIVLSFRCYCVILPLLLYLILYTFSGVLNKYQKVPVSFFVQRKR